MKKTLKISYRDYEMLIVHTRHEGIECYLVYVDHRGVAKRGEALSERMAITLGMNFINRIAV